MTNLEGRCWEKIVSSLPPSVLEEMPLKPDVWDRPTLRTAHLCRWAFVDRASGDEFDLNQYTTYRNVCSPMELARAIVGDEKVWNPDFGLDVRLHRCRFPGPRNPENALSPTELSRLLKIYENNPLRILEDLENPCVAQSYGIFFEDEAGWRKLLSECAFSGGL